MLHNSPVIRQAGVETMPGPSRNHHVVPQLFLRGFGQALCEHNRDGTARNVSVKRAAVIRDAYATADGSATDDSLENWLGGHIENPAAGVVRALRRGVVPSGDNLVSASAFVAFQMVRGPSFRRRLAELASIIGPLLFATTATSKAIKKSPNLFASDDELARISGKVMEMAPPEVRETKKDADLAGHGAQRRHADHGTRRHELVNRIGEPETADHRGRARDPAKRAR